MRKVIANPESGLKPNIMGQKFGHLVVLHECGRTKRRNVLWLCQCVCGGKTTAITTILKSGAKLSCGCKRYRKGSEMPNWSGVGEISGSYLCHIRTGAANRNLTFNVTGEYLWTLFLDQNKKCKMTGVELEFGNKSTASLDRLDSLVGYEIGNLQWVHKDINLMRNYFSVGYFVEMCGMVSSHAAKAG